MTIPAKQGLPVRVQFTLNPILHRDAITLLQGLSKSDLAETVAGLLQLGALVQNSMHQGQFAFLTASLKSRQPPALPGNRCQRPQALHRPQRKPTSISCLHRG